MANTKTFRGGVRVGVKNFTYPFASLSLTSDSINIEVSGNGNFIFKPTQVICLKKRIGGIQIFHNVNDYPPLIIFWGKANKIIKTANEFGFVPIANGEITNDEYTAIISLRIVGYGFFIFLIILSIILMILSNPK